MAETTTISNLPQITIDELTNDTLVPVENVDGTKATNLAQLRKKLNSTYVELVDANLNDLKEDGFYECWGTTLNAPTSDVGAWIVQTATHESVTVQNAFGLGETTFSYMYRRRWNGVSWTAWENKINWLQARVSTLENEKANVANTVTTDTAQTITGTKTFKDVVTAELEPINFIAKNPTMDVNETPSANKYVGYDFRDKNNVRIGYIGIKQSTDGKLTYEIQKMNNNVTAIAGITPPASSAATEIVTAGWVLNFLSTSGQAYTWSKNQNGYIKFSNGFIIQWGHSGANRQHQYNWDTVTYPIAFTSFQVAQATMYSNDSTWAGDASQTAQGSIKRIGLTGMQCYYTNSNGFDWVAVGF